MAGRVKVVCLGNPLRGDDAAGLLVAKLLREKQPDAEIVEATDAADLLTTLEGADAAIIVDAASSGSKPGTIHRLENPAKLPRDIFKLSTHATSVAEALRLAETLDILPRRIIVYGIEGACFGLGSKPTPQVERAAARVADEIRRDLDRLRPEAA